MNRRPRVATAARARRPRATLLTLCLVAAAAALASGCGSGAQPTAPPAASPTPTPAGIASPSPAPYPQITAGPVPAGAVHAVRRFWRLLEERHFAQVRARVAPGSPLAEPDTKWGPASVRLLAVCPRALAVVPSYATVEFRVSVYVKPGAGTNAWGPAGSRSLWMTVTRMSDRSWRVYEFGTGP